MNNHILIHNIDEINYTVLQKFKIQKSEIIFQLTLFINKENFGLFLLVLVRNNHYCTNGYVNQ